MEINVLEAIVNIVENSNYVLEVNNSSMNRVNAYGENFENYVVDAFINSFSKSEEKNEIISEYFSYLGMLLIHQT